MEKGMVLTNGNIYTLDPIRPKATAVAIHGGRILAVGDDLSIAEIPGIGGELIDLGGRCVVPGLVDAHVHFQGFSIYRQYVDLDGASSLKEVISRIAADAERHEGPNTDSGTALWMRGRGWSQAAWEEGRFPNAADLDPIIPNRPAAFIHKSGHASWVNSKAMQIAGISVATPDPPGGQIQRDVNGRPTGIFFEEAIKLISDVIPEPTTAEISDAMRAAQVYCWQVGLTGIHDFDGRSCFWALQSLKDAGDLGLRVVKNIPASRVEHAVGVGLRSGFGDEWLRIGGIKIFADGALGPRTALMVEPYEDAPDNFGIAVTEKEEMMAIAELATSNGLSLTVHAIGDRANHDVLDVYEALRRQEAQQKQEVPLRHRIEHVQLLHPSDLNRLAKLNVIASMQPIHATSDMYMADEHWGGRAKFSYAWRTMLDSGAHLVFGSDAPVEIIDPLPGIYAAVTRRRADGSPGVDGWYSEQKLTMEEAIRAYAWGAAVTAGQENNLGTISPGKMSDLTIFERDLFAAPHDELLDIGVAGTVIAGQFKYRTW